MNVVTSLACMTSLAALTLAAFVAILQQCISCYHGNNSYGSSSTLESKKLVIGILSAREHFEKRQAIRKTWLQDMNQSDVTEKVMYKFVVGNKGCDLHPLNRKDPYSCERLNFSYTKQMENENFQVVSLKERRDEVTRFSKYNVIWNTSVIVRYPVIVKRLGLLSAVKLTERSVIVQLYDENTEEVVVSAKFSSVDPGVAHGTKSESLIYRYQPTSHILLPKDYECSLRVIMDKNINFSMLNTYFSVNNAGGTVQLLPVDEKGFYFHTKTENDIFMGNFVISLNDVNRFKEIQKSQPQLDEKHMSTQREIIKKLENEKNDYNDIVFVNVTDTYRNLPLKLLYFHQWIQSQFQTQFVLKMDDDCFVNIKNILTELSSLPLQTKIWWGNFRDNWFVERFGKWAEKVYRADEYPSFACGSGNIVSNDISDWLARNAGVLFPYQGEDTSMGIWLTALGPDYVDDNSWLCDEGCEKEALVIPQLSVERMQVLWKNKLGCDNICGCE